MRSFVISIILLGVMLICVSLNAFYLQSVFEKMLELTNALPATDSPDFGAKNSKSASLPYEHWNKCKTFVGCTVNMKYVTAISDLAALVHVSYAAGNKEIYVCAKELLRSQLEELKKAEQLSLLGIL